MSGLDIDTAIERIKELAIRFRAAIPHGFAFSLILYRVPVESGAIVVISEDRAAAKTAVQRWLREIEAPAPKGRA